MPTGISAARIWMLSVVLAIVFGGAAGWVCSSATVMPSLRQVQDLVSQIQRPVTGPTATTTPVQIIPVQPTIVGSTTLPDALSTGRATPTLALFHTDARTSDTLMFAQDQLAPVVALTADGWLVVPSAIIPSALHLTDLSIGYQHVLYTPKKGMRDTATGLTYLKIDAQNLPVASLVPRVEVELGESVWRETVPNQYVQGAVMRVGSSAASATSLSSDQWNRKFLLSDTAAPAVSAIWDHEGRLVGIADASAAKMVIPADAIKSGLTSLLASGDIRRPTLGVHYIEIADAYAPVNGKKLPEKGALIEGDKHGTVAVLAGGAAAKVLKEGDVIERIDNDVLDGTWTLAERVLEYRPGSQVAVSGTRDGKPFTAQVTFGSMTTSETLK